MINIKLPKPYAMCGVCLTDGIQTTGESCKSCGREITGTSLTIREESGGLVFFQVGYDVIEYHNMQTGLHLTQPVEYSALTNKPEIMAR